MRLMMKPVGLITWLLLCRVIGLYVLLADDPVAAAARDLHAPQSRGRALLALHRMARSGEDATACRALVVLGPELYDKPAELRPLLERFREPLAKNFGYPRISGFTEYCRLQAHDNAGAAAILLLERARTEAADGLPQVLIDEAFGDVMLIPGDLQKARGHYRRALESGNHFYRKRTGDYGERDPNPPPPHAAAWPHIRKRIESKKKELVRRLRIEAHGLDFVLYEEGRIAQQQGVLNEARRIYEHLIELFPDSIYAEAGRFYRGLCLTGRDRLQALQTFYTSRPQGLYRGEARLQLGLQYLTEEWQPQRARKEFSDAIQWCQDMRRLDRAVALFAIPEKSRATSAPPPDNQRLKDGLFIEPLAIEPGKLVNRQTARWYLNEIEKQARLGLVFILFIDKEWEAARKVLDPILDLDSHLRQAQEGERLNSYFRLTLCCRYRKIDTNDEELSRVPRGRRIQIQYAEFITLQRRFMEARTRYEALLRQAAATGDDATQAVVSVALADLYQMQGHRQAAISLLQKVIRDFPKHRISARACFYLGNLIGGRLADPEGSQESLRLYEQAMRIYPRSYVATAARSAAARRLAGLGHDEQALAMAAGLDPQTRTITMESILAITAARQRRLAQ